MNDKEYLKIVADARRSVSRKYGFRQSSYINFKIEEGYFFCLYFLNNEVRLTVKPMYADELWWDIWGASENKKEPLSLRGTGAYSLSGQILASYQIEETTDGSKLTNICEEIFHNATVEISKFLTTNPDVDSFFPDESKMEHDPDRLLYLITLIHNGREDKALEIIKEARQDKHSCMFQSGMFSDSYTYIQRWCNRGQTNMRIRNAFVSIFNCIVKIRAYALMSLGGDNKYDDLYGKICCTLNRRMLDAETLNLPTYPNEPIYVPDMLVAVVALSHYAELNNGRYQDTVNRWIEKAKTDWLDAKTGLLVSFLDNTGAHQIGDMPVKGSYSALNCYYLSLIDKSFAKEQYERLKHYFYQSSPISGLKEYHDRFFLFGMDADAGPIIANLSPSGTAFMVGSATYFGDFDVRRNLLKTAEIAGSTFYGFTKNHYLLANFALVGEAIMLAMRTNVE